MFGDFGEVSAFTVKQVKFICKAHYHTQYSTYFTGIE